MLLAALYLRTAGLMDVQGFGGDQGRDYLEVMKWLQDGHWPLLGPLRVTGDHTLGPGWYYTLAPAMALSGFHPVAGAATVALLTTLAIFLMADWVRRSSGSRAAALVTAAVAAFSTEWILQGRGLWSPHLMPLGVAALAWLITIVRRRPAAGLAGAVIVMAILPQWHTPGLVVDAAMAPFLAAAVWAAWPAARATGRRAWWAWGAVAGAAVGLLYVPPLLYELRPGPGNLVSFFSQSNLPALPFAGSLPWRAGAALDELLRLTTYQAFYIHDAPDAVGRRLLLAGAIALGVLFVCAGDLRRRAAQPAVGALALVTIAFWLILILKGRSVQDYFLLAVPPALLMLGGWTAGRLLTAPETPGAKVRVRWLAGAGLLLLAGALTLAQLPRAWAVHQGAAPSGFTFRVTREAAEYIAQDAGARPFSVELAEPINFPAHYFYLLRWLGRRPLNGDFYRHGIRREEMGERIYIIVGAGMEPEPALKGWAGPLPEPVAVRNLLVYRIEMKTLPARTREMKVEVGAEGRTWALEAEE